MSSCIGSCIYLSVTISIDFILSECGLDRQWKGKVTSIFGQKCHGGKKADGCSCKKLYVSQ